MKNKNELNYKDLKMTCNPDIFHFDTTEELEPIQDGIGQDRGIKALEFGLQVDVKGYNLYLEGPSGVGKTMYTKNYLQKIATKKKVPSDWCYIYNFENPNEPIAVELPAGQGKEFKEAMDGFIKEIQAQRRGALFLRQQGNGKGDHQTGHVHRPERCGHLQERPQSAGGGGNDPLRTPGVGNGLSLPGARALPRAAQ